MQINFFKARWQILGALLFLTLAVFFDRSNLDLKVTTFFYDFEKAKFLGQNQFVFDFLYDYLPIISWITFLLFVLRVCRLYFINGLPLSKIKIEFFLAAALLGAVLLVDTIKMLVARPRPYQLALFEGEFEYEKISLFVNSGLDASMLNSFPSGHAVSGYSMIIVSIFWLKYHQYTKAYLTYAFGIFLGIILSFCRIAQGGHFLSDTLGSLALSMLLTALGCILIKKNSLKAEAKNL